MTLPPQTPQFALAQQHHQAGRYAQAESLCRDILAQQPDQIETLHLLGMTLHKAGNLAGAIGCYRTILTLTADSQVHNNLGVALRAQGELEAAADHYQQAIGLHPTPGVYNNLGNLLRQQGKLEESIAAYRQALILAPAHADAFNSIGLVLRQQGKAAEAIVHYQQVLARYPQDADAHNNLGNTFQEQDKFAEAIPCYQKALELRPHTPAFYNNLGAALQELGRLEESIAIYQQALALKPDYPDAYYNLGNAFKAADRFEDCVGAYQQAIALRAYPEAWNNLGLVLYELGRLEESIAAYRQALALQPDYPDAHLNLSLSLLATGDLQQGFREYEYRWQVQGKNFKPPRTFEQPLWDGSDLDGKTILLHAEQGFGDTIQFIRYAPLVVDRGGRVVVECQEALLRLLQTVPAIEQLIPAGAELPAFHAHAPLLSLPHLLNPAGQTIPDKIPYLAPPPATHLLLAPDPSLPAPLLKVGIVWAGSPDHDNDRHRSCPFAQIQTFFDLPEVQFYSLQKGSRAADLEAKQVKDLGFRLRDFADTAAVIAQLDLVITVDTAVAHLAGAIGRSTWVLLSFAADWRWLRHRTDTPWYPTLRLFWQTTPGDWASAIDPAKAALLHLLGTKAYRSGNLASAIGYYQQSLMLVAATDVHLSLANALRRQGNLAAAIDHYQQAIAIEPNNPFPYNNLGVTLRQQGKLSESIAAYRQALTIAPNYPDTHYNLANLLRGQDDLTAAASHYQQAIALRPNYINAWINLGNTLKTQGKVEEAMIAYRQVLAIDPDHASAHNNLGHVLLLSGDLRQGFAENEWRWRVENYKRPRPPLSQPLWDGSDLNGKTILLYAEQGLGDTIQFIRYAPLVVDRGGHVVVECQPALARLLQTVRGIDQIVSRGEPLPPFDVHAPLLSLPHLFGTTLETVPAETPYLFASESAIDLDSDAMKIGIVWAGSSTNRNDRHRSCPLHHFFDLLDLPNITFYSLQKDVSESPWVNRAADLQQFADAEKIIDLSQQLDDFADTAAVIAQLDLVISVDTAVAHLAAAMGKPVWLLLCFDADWRWMKKRWAKPGQRPLDSPWYPTVKIFRQTQLGDWSTVFAAVKAEIKAEIKKALQPASSPSIPASLFSTRRLGIGWQLGAATGWGIYGVNLALHLLQTDFAPVPLLPSAVAAAFSPLHQKLLQPVFDQTADIRAAQQSQLDFPILKGLGNQFVTAPELEQVSGSQNFGVIFFEDTALNAAALERSRQFDRIITGSTWNANILRSFGLTQVDTVLQGIDPTLFHPAPKSGMLGDRFVIFSGGKLEYRKGQDIVIRAFREFHARHPEALLLTAWHNFWAHTMVGLARSPYVQGLPRVVDGRLRLGEWLVANGIPQSAFIDLGIVPNALVGQILREADVALFPNRCEGGTNLAAMESLACGIPTILSANTGHLDLIGNDRCYGLRSQSPVLAISPKEGYEGWGESDIEEVLETLEAVYADRATAQQRGAAAARFMQDWSWDRQMAKLLSVLHSL